MPIPARAMGVAFALRVSMLLKCARCLVRLGTDASVVDFPCDIGGFTMQTMRAQVVHATIARNWHEVYEFAHKPENMPKWASGLANGLRSVGIHKDGFM